ncbi:hypothetical protein DUNSADRAFT_13152 [Dunaliella salina]|uniref:Encoded protein n=1 Tax=Dunaliella salina TaxID=3046 RepID=A0ABQ7G9Y5_DUNSA|nr:hypothetical protein DUNSADRAFT_13152 [Dunaliella salina]|eukprot:KAF5831417.1 hypothetical protein DUNSADRAFT_13152 [Dunaliella salina]
MRPRHISWIHKCNCFAEDTGYAALFRVEEQLAKIAGRIDKAKQQILFPEAKGYQFSTGDSGVYVGCQDLFLSEVSGRFEVRCRRVTKSDGNYAASLFISFGGVSCTTDSTEARMSSRPSGGEKDPSGSHARNLRKNVNVRQSAGPGSPSRSAADKAAASAASPFDNPAVGPSHHHTRTGSTGSNLAPPPSSTASPARPQHEQQQPHTPGATPSSSGRSSMPNAAGFGTHAHSYQQQQHPSPSMHSPPHKERGLGSYRVAPLDVPLPPLPGRASQEPAHPKGEMVASFLSGLSRKKHKYKKKAEQDMLGTPSRSSSGAKGLGDRIEHKFNKFGESMRDGMGLGSKGKLSKLGKLIAIKAPKSGHNKEDSKFGDEIPSQYFHVEER